MGVYESYVCRKTIDFKKLVKKYHPDTNSGDKKFENKLKEITIAYTLLRNNQKNVNHGQ